jgi:hypothetical protein
MSETLNNDEMKPDLEKGLEEVVVAQDKVPGAEAETKTKAGTRS